MARQLPVFGAVLEENDLVKQLFLAQKNMILWWQTIIKRFFDNIGYNKLGLGYSFCNFVRNLIFTITASRAFSSFDNKNPFLDTS